MTAPICLRIVVHGIVQGVGFRFAASEAAAACSVNGWVRNLPDGSVEIVAQGAPDAVAELPELRTFEIRR